MKRRELWRFHLSTLLLMLLWVNLFFIAQRLYVRPVVAYEPTIGSIVCDGYGWPWVQRFKRPKTEDEYDWGPLQTAHELALSESYRDCYVHDDFDLDLGLLGNVLAFGLLGCGTAIFNERRIRRHPV